MGTISESRLRWECRRGMRELDELLLGYFERRYPNAPEPEKAAFRELLALPDARLIGYLLDAERIEERAIEDVVRRVRNRAHTDEPP